MIMMEYELQTRQGKMNTRDFRLIMIMCTTNVLEISMKSKIHCSRGSLMSKLQEKDISREREIFDSETSEGNQIL